MFKNVYFLLIGVFAMMLVGFLNTSDVEVTTLTQSETNILNPALVNYSGFGITLVQNGDDTFTINGTVSGTQYVSLLDVDVSHTTSSLLHNTSTNLLLDSDAYVLSINILSGSMSSANSYILVNGVETPKIQLVLPSASNYGELSNTLVNSEHAIMFGFVSGTVYTNYTFNIMLEKGTVASPFEYYDVEVTTLVNGTDDYIQSIISASPYLVSMFVIVGVVSFLVTGKKEDE